VAGRDIVRNIIANDKASKPLKDVGKAAEQTAGSLNELSAAEQRLQLATEIAKTRVEKATTAATRAVERFGKESIQAREASLRLRAAQLDLADASDKAEGQLNAAGHAADRAGRRFDGLRARVGTLGSTMKHLSGVGLGAGMGGLASVGAVVPALAGLTAGFAAFGTVAIPATSAAIGFGIHIAATGAKVAKFAGTVGPAAASLLPLAAGLGVVVTTLKLMGPALAESVSSTGTAFTKAGDAAGVVAAKGVSDLSRSFVRLNMPGIRSNMLYIADAVNGVVTSVGKWLNSVTGQKAIATSVTNVAEAFHELAPDVSALAIAFLNLFSRTAGDTRAIDLLATGLNRALVGATNFINGLTPAKIDAAWAALHRFAGDVQDFAGKVAGWGAAIMGAVRWWQRHAEEIQHVRDVLAVVAIAVGVATGGWIPALVAGVSLLVAHWDKVSSAMSGAIGWMRSSDTAGRAQATAVNVWSDAVSGLVGWYREWLAPTMAWLGQQVMPQLEAAGHDLAEAFRAVSGDTAFWTGAAKVLGGILIGTVVVAVGITVGTIRTLTFTVRAAAEILHGFAVGFMAVRDGTEVAGTAIRNWFIDLRAKIRNFFVDSMTWLHEGGKNLGLGLRDGAQAAWNATSGFLFGTMKTKIRNFFTDGTTWLHGAGKDVLNGLFDGARAAWKAAKGWAVDLKNTVVGAVKDAFGIHSPSRVMMGLGGSMVDGLIHGIIRKNPTALITKVFGGTTQALQSMVSSGLIGAGRLTGKAMDALGGMLGGPAVQGGNRSNRALGKTMAGAFGWAGEAQWNALDRLWMGESGWNSNAKNTTSTAFGIPQFLKSTGSAYGLAYGNTNPAAQISAGLQYIKDVYGSPLGAYSAWSSRSPHWYANGGVINEPVMGVGLRSGDRYGFGERGPETVVPGRVHAVSGGSGTVKHETTIHINATGSDIELENKLVRVLTSASNGGRLKQIGIST
jgi:hypothetical protein